MRKMASVAMLSVVLTAIPAWGQDAPAVRRASNLTGMSVQNGETGKAEVVGRVEDIVVNLRDGRIVYYAMSHGQTLGLGGKMFAIAPRALQHSSKGEFLVLEDATNAALTKMDGFDSNKWPAEPDKHWAKAGPVGKAVGKAVETVKETVKGEPRLARVEAIIGASVRTADNKDLGSIYDLAVDPKKNKIAYVAVSHGGTLGVGGKLYAVPLEKFQIQSPQLNLNQRVFTLHVTPEQLKNAAGFTSDQNWPAQPDQPFWSKVKSDDAVTN